MGLLRWKLPSRHTGGGSRILWQWPAGRYACFSGFFDMPRSLKRSPQLHATHSIDMAAPWVCWGGNCRVDIPAAGRAFCDSDLQAVMRVSLAFLICHDRWKGHHNCRQQIQSIWQRSATGQLVRKLFHKYDTRWDFGQILMELCHVKHFRFPFFHVFQCKEAIVSGAWPCPRPDTIKVTESISILISMKLLSVWSALFSFHTHSRAPLTKNEETSMSEFRTVVTLSRSNSRAAQCHGKGLRWDSMPGHYQHESIRWGETVSIYFQVFSNGLESIEHTRMKGFKFNWRCRVCTRQNGHRDKFRCYRRFPD